MQYEVASAIVSAGQEFVNEPSHIRLKENYSGRGMVGRTTTAVIVNNDNTLVKAVAIASARWYEADQTGDAPLSFERFLDGLDFRQDNYGYDKLIY